MSRSGHDKPTAAPAPRIDSLDLVAFYVLLAVLAARPMISEVFEHTQLSFLTALQPDQGPTPATTAWLDFILLAAATVALVRRRRWCASPAALAGAIALVAAAAVSSMFAGDKHTAWLAGADLAIGVLGGLALAKLLQARWMGQLLVAALLATGAATAIKCVCQSTFEYEQTKEFWEQEHKPALIKQGFDPDDPLLVNFERRMLASEAQGFMSHPNVTGSCLMMWLLIAAGAIATAFAARWPAPLAVAIPLAAVVAAALWFTGSLGAQVGCAVGILAAAVLALLRWRLAWPAGRILALLAAGYVAVIGATAAYGLARGTLPHPSLQFRWYYWTAAGRAIEDAPFTGLGRENFTYAYMLYKPPESTEEVRNPHNLWLNLLCEMGPLGLAGGALLAWIALRRALGNLSPAEDEPPHAVPSHKLTVARVAPLVISVLAAHALFSGTPFGRPGVALVWGQEILLVWTLALLVSVWLLEGLLADWAHLRWLALGLCAALVASCTHALVSFALLTPGGLAVFVLTAVAAGAVVRPERRAAAKSAEADPQVGVAAVAIGLCALATQLALAVSTSYIAQDSKRLDAALRTTDTDRALSSASILIEQSRGNSAAARAGGRALLHLGRRPGLPDDQRLEVLQRAAQAAEISITDNPLDMNNYTLLARVQLELAAYWRSRGDDAQALAALRSAAHSADRSVQRYPSNPRARISAGQAWFKVWQRTDDSHAAEQATRHLEAALQVNSLWSPTDTVRLRTREVDQIRALLEQMRAGD